MDKVVWTPASDEDALGLIGEGLHTGLRKIGQSNEAAEAWSAIRAMPGSEWTMYLEWTLEGMRSMGYEICKKEIQ